MFGAVLMKRGKDGKDTILGAEDVKPTETKSEPDNAGIPLMRYDLLAKVFERPKTYERLVHDLYVAGWTIKEAKSLLKSEPQCPEV